MKHKPIVYLVLFLVVIAIAGCGEDIPIFTENLKVIDIVAVQSSLGVGETTTIEATVDYTGDATVLMYTWTASGGTIQGSGSRVVYKAPSTPGTYSISLTVTDGAVSSGKTIEIHVVQGSTEVSLILDRDTHWPGEAQKDKLAYDVRITRVVSKKVLLHFDITQDKDKFDAFLSIQIGGKIVLQDMAIGNEQPSTGIRTIRDIDVSNVITGPGRYMVTFYIEPGDRVENGWLMNEAKIIGVEGTSDPQQ